MQEVLVFYSEIGIKGKNKSDFEKALRRNIKYSSKFNNVNLISTKNEGGGVICIFDDTKDNIIKVLSSVLGIKYFSFVKEIKKTKEAIFTEAKSQLDELKKDGIKFINIQTKRADKGFELTSPQINSQIGQFAKDRDIKVDYKNKENIIYIKINFKKIYMYSKKFNGLDGLPIGTSGRVLVLLSGGIDSPVAAFQLMKRGCICDFLHLHNLKNEKEFENSKIIETIKILNKFQYKSRVYSVSYTDFEFEILGKVIPRYELVIFKHYLLKLAQTLAIQNNYQAIANGDSLAQVASQTIDNLNVVNYSIDFPIFRPLLTFEKESIIELARKIGTFEIAIEKYKDCCSLVAINPLTKSKLDKFKKSLDNINLPNLIEKNLNSMQEYKID